MNRHLPAIATAILLAAGADAMGATRGKAAFDVAEKSVAQLQAAMASGRATSVGITRQYLARIRALDKSGPKLNSVIELNPDALKIAAALDRERKEKGPRGPLHGIPVLVKDNIATHDAMQTTAGSLALLGAKPPRDAFVVAKLREAGAVILGKTNLSEWANIRSTRSTSGWSSRGGLTRNPYALDRNASGSSSGSGTAAAASLAAVTVGTETDGSITSPSSVAGLVGIKPTVGLLSRAGIIPISPSQDTPGPMARSVADAALLLAAMAGTDPRDAATAQADAHSADYAKSLDPGALKGARIGVVKSQLANAHDLVRAEVLKGIEAMRAQGAVIVEVPEVPNVGKYESSELTVLLYELKASMGDYLAEYAPTSPLKSLDDIIAYNEKHKAKVMPWFGQEHFLAAAAKGGLDAPEYLDALANGRKYSREEGIDQVLKEYRLDALVAPTGGPAWMTDFVKGDAEGSGFTSPAAVAGYPHITVPVGMVHGLPCGISLVGTAWSEPRLVALAYAFEQATRARRPPKYAKTVNDW